MSHSHLPPYSDHEAEDHPTSTGAQDIKLKDRLETSLPTEATRTQLPAHLDYSRDRDGNIICTDSILDDPVYFSAFVQLHGGKPPDVRLQITGTHWEDNSDGPDRSDGNTIKSTSRRLVTDFDFDIPLTSEILIQRNRNTPPYFFTYKPNIPTYRNSTIKKKQSEQAEQARLDVGLSVGQQAIVDYLSATQPLKEFRFEKVVSGWDMKVLKRQIEVIIRRTGYLHTVNVTLREKENYLFIRPPNKFSLIYRHPFTFFMRCVVFPLGLVMLLADYIYFGAYWQVLGAKYDLYSVNPSTGEERGLSVDRFLVLFGEEISRAAQQGQVGKSLNWPGLHHTSGREDVDSSGPSRLDRYQNEAF